MANECGQTVVAQNGKTYYIGATGGESIIIKTSVEFGTAKFTIDDTWITYTKDSNHEHYTERLTDIFVVASDYGRGYYNASNDTLGIIEKLNARGGVKKTDTALDLGLGYDAMLIPWNNQVQHYNRWGNHAGTAGADANGDGIIDGSNRLVGGGSQGEIIILKADGTIDQSAGLLFDIDNVSAYTLVRIDDTPITISGGTFTTKATQAHPGSDYANYARGIKIERSNVTIRGMKHYVTNEPQDYVCVYGGFVSCSYCNNFLMTDSVLTGRKNYKNNGSYDIGGSYSNSMVFRNVTQSNFYKDEANDVIYTQDEYWGIMGTNGCKNIEYHDCILSRLDAHAGVVNVVIKNTLIRDIYLTGGGTATIEGTTVYNNRFISLRVDYGSIWDGDMLIKDCIQKIQNKADTTKVSIIHGEHYNWEFGFNSIMPRNVVIDNYITDRPEHPNFYIFDYGATSASMEDTMLDGSNNPTPNVNPLTVTEKVTIKNHSALYPFTEYATHAWLETKIQFIVED